MRADATPGEFDLLTMAEVGALLKCSKAHVSNMIAGRISGCAAIPSVRLGRRTLVRRSSLLAWIAANENAPCPAMILESPERGARKHA
jgi:excisionase family DNA binding protein